MKLQQPHKRVINKYDSGIWKLDRFLQWLSQEEQDAVESIPIPICMRGGKDRLIWPHYKVGEYTVKSGYYILRNSLVNFNAGPSTSHAIDDKVWKSIWKLNFRVKERCFCGNVVIMLSLSVCCYGEGKQFLILPAESVSNLKSPLNACCCCVIELEDYAQLSATV